MDQRQLNFLTAVLGSNGAKVMAQLSESSEVVRYATVPRTIVSWIDSNSNYNANLPGTDINLTLIKNESGFSGQFNSIEFESVSLERAAATIAVGLGVNVSPSKLKDIDLAKLGKTIDLLVKAQQGAASDGNAGGLAQGHHPAKGAVPVTGKDVVAVKPIEPEGPKLADPTTKKPLGNKGAKMALSEEESNKVCKVCKGKQKDDSGNIKGCHCVRDLSSGLTVKKTETGYEVEFGTGWDAAAIAIFTSRIKHG